MIQSTRVSINVQDKGQVYIDGRVWQIHLFLQCLCFKCHSLMNLQLKQTFRSDEMSLWLSADQIRWMKVKQEQKNITSVIYSSCIAGSGPVRETPPKQTVIATQHRPLIYFPLCDSLLLRKDILFKCHTRHTDVWDLPPSNVFFSCSILLNQPALPFQCQRMWEGLEERECKQC